MPGMPGGPWGPGGPGGPWGPLGPGGPAFLPEKQKVRRELLHPLSMGWSFAYRKSLETRKAEEWGWLTAGWGAGTGRSAQAGWVSHADNAASRVAAGRGSWQHT